MLSGSLIMGLTLYPRPPDEYCRRYCRQLAAIGKNINQIARTVANASRLCPASEDIRRDHGSAGDDCGTAREAAVTWHITKVFAIRVKAGRPREATPSMGRKTALDEQHRLHR